MAVQTDIQILIEGEMGSIFIVRTINCSLQLMERAINNLNPTNIELLSFDVFIIRFKEKHTEELFKDINLQFMKYHIKIDENFTLQHNEKSTDKVTFQWDIRAEGNIS